MNQVSEIRDLTASELDSVSGGCKDHEDAGKELADAIQEATHKVLEWFRNL